jgi:transposase
MLQEIDSVYGSLELDDHCLYENLDWLSENQSHIEAKIFKHRWKKDSIKNLFLYDVTSSYLEGEHNELAAYGYNRDKKKGKKQIVIGLMTDNLGYPVSVEVFDGNTSDPQTVLSQLKKLKNLFNVQKVVFVGDKGMIKSQQIEDIKNDFKTWGYLTTITKNQIKTLMLNEVFQYRLFDKKMIEVKDSSGIRYILRRNPTRAQEITKNRKDKIKACMEEMKKKNQYLKDHSRAKPKVAIRNLESFITKLKLSKILSVTHIKRVLTINTSDSELETAAKLDGCYVVKTNVSKEILSTEEAHDRYKDLSLVESSFRRMKTTLEKIRPLYVRKKSRTKGHVFICSLGYMIVKYIQEKTKHLKYSLQFILNCLDNIHTLKYVWNGKNEMLLPPIYTLAQAEILKALDLKLNL